MKKILLINKLSKAVEWERNHNGTVYFKINVHGRKALIRLADHPQYIFKKRPVLLDLRWAETEEQIKEKVLKLFEKGI